ncbi:unnamed protein product [Prorocentrum cordatum]|uniref:Uncharacterized protein n=1 Tax=Prorocentrum cordatum TaxID=2364126 RepID=A0ABN9PXW3_9DINO|nr:unnamed protein product [Polarella glacialis]
MFFITSTCLCALSVLGTQVLAIHHRMHGSQLRRLHTPITLDAFYTATSCGTQGQVISDTSACDEAAGALGFSIGYMGTTDYGGDCAQWAVLGMQNWYYYHASNRPNAKHICRLPAYALGGVKCPAGYSEISSAAECDAAGITLNHSVSHNPEHGVQCYVRNEFGSLSVCKLPTYVLPDFATFQCPLGYAFLGAGDECVAAASDIGIPYFGIGNCPVCGAVSLRVVPTPSPTPGIIWQENCNEFADGFTPNNWGKICQNLPTAPVPEYIRIKIGQVTDYFRPITGASYCDMLTSPSHHQWSNDFLTWRTPDYYHGHVGGSAANWPKNNVDGDNRKFLTFWGNGFGGSGGCCHITYGGDSPMPGRPFTMDWCSAPTLITPRGGGPTASPTPAPSPAPTPAPTRRLPRRRPLPPRR